MKSFFIFFITLFLAVFCLAEIDPVIKQSIDNAAANMASNEYEAAQPGQDEIDNIIRTSLEDAHVRQYLETVLTGILKDSDASYTAKVHSCRRLGQIGAENAADELGELLSDEKLSHMARFGLEALGTETACKELIKALEITSGLIKAGIINSLGVLEYEPATDMLIDAADSSDPVVIEAAVSSLGKIANKKSVDKLMSMQKYSNTTETANALLEAADRLEKAGNKSDAVDIYAYFYEKGEPTYMKIAGFGGLLKSSDGRQREKLINQALSGRGIELRQTAVRYVEDYAGESDLKQLLAKYDSYPQEAKVLLLEAVRNRKYDSARDIVLKEINSESAKIKIAAIKALTAVGKAADIPMLAALSVSENQDIAAAARNTLLGMNISDPAETFTSAMTDANPQELASLISVAASRNITAALSDVCVYLESEDKQVRKAAAEMAARLGKAEHLDRLIAAYDNAESSSDKRDIEKALRSICIRNSSDCYPIVMEAYRNAQTMDYKVFYLKMLAAARGEKTLETIRAAVKSDNERLKDTAIRLLTGWDSDETALDLLEIAAGDEALNYRVLAAQNYIRIVRYYVEPAQAKIESLKKILPAAQRDQEKRIIVSTLASIPHRLALEMLSGFIDNAQLRTEVAMALLSQIKELKYKETGLLLKTVLSLQDAGVEGEQAEALAHARAELEQVQQGLLAAFEFETDSGGWAAENHCRIEIEDGNMAVMTEGPDPFIVYRGSLPGGELSVQMRLKAPPSAQWQVFWGSSQKPLAQAPLWIIGLEIPETDSQWQDVDFTINVDGSLTELRIDPVQTEQPIVIDSIKIFQLSNPSGFSKSAKKKILFIGSDLDHPYNTHVYMHGCEILAKCVEQTPGVDAWVTKGWPQDLSIVDQADAVVLYSSPGADLLLKDGGKEIFEKVANSKKGFAALHWSTGAAYPGNEERSRPFLRCLGGIFNTEKTGLDICSSTVMQIEPSHPVCTGWSDYLIYDEYYLDMQTLEEIEPVLKIKNDKHDNLVAWTYIRPSGGRSYVNTLGHFNYNFWIPSFRKMYINGILWTAGIEVPENGAPCTVSPEDIQID
jgi:HEAT repeat protein